MERPAERDSNRERNILAWLLNRLEQYRRLAACYEKWMATYQGVVALGALALWL
jgi:hypothetical protein